ncbi:hypothetical protein RJ639_015773 [Escallonia herrerae]|uniref:Kinesin motor domain-containing protein n=1 Tax=Escallonia herrerae TaxID=1293975 RepID=A0AA88VGC3_9ASTE|nr:hypothetical protein RJ639_015773 [Escallonia herrerae]
MFISTGQEEISLPLENGRESTKSFPLDGLGSMKSSPLGSHLNFIDGELPSFESPESPSIQASFTDVSVVPEHEKEQLEQTISNLEGEILSLKQKLRSLDEKRRHALNKMLDIKGCIRVFCRVRPFVLTNKRRIHEPISVESEKIVVKSGGSRKEFGFDKVFPQEASQEEVFVEVEPILRSALDGHNVCIVAYGQTGTGKTFTMDGTGDSPGVVPRALKELFHQASLMSATSFTFSISMLEVYLGNLRDLLALKPSGRSYAVSRCNLNIQTDSKGSVEIEGLTEVQISNLTKASWWYTKGRRVRSTSWTNVNEASSRSHCLTRITIYRLGDAPGAKTEVSKFWMVDLGGSERLLKTGATGQTLDEGRAINLSLSALGDVIAGLRRKRGHVPYRNSKLTQILRDSLGMTFLLLLLGSSNESLLNSENTCDGSKALMLVHVSPYEEDVGETTCSFTFAKRARAVESNRELQVDSKKLKERRISELEEEMREAEEECQKVRNQMQKVEFLLSENKRRFMTNHQLLEDEGKTLASPKGYQKEASRTPQTLEKAIKRRNATSFMPRFMVSTVASRQRKDAAEKEIDDRARSLRSVSRSSMQISGSQSLSYSDPHFKAIVRNPNKKSRYGEANSSTTENAKCNDSDSKPSAMPRAKAVTSSDPNLRATLGRHRRRMSNLI